jgi:peptidoglycan-associated lipoprotein
MNFVRPAIVAIALLLAACETPPDSSSSTMGQGGSATGSGSGVSGSGTGGVQGQGLGPNASAQALNEAVQRIGDRVFFAFDSSEMRDDGRQVVQRWAQFLGQNPNAMAVIEGHTDDRGTREYNLGLGERRATSVRNYLVSLGVPASRVSTVSYGKERPAAVGSNQQSWSQNRRGVLVFN